MHDVLISPLVTEKSTILKSHGVYTFRISKRANKVQVRQAIKKIFNVDPIKCRILVVKPKKKLIRNRRGYGKTSFIKKAMVVLKKGQNISDLEG